MSYTDKGEPFVAAAQQNLQERLIVMCSRCQVKMRVTRRMAGQVVRCLSCSQDIQIPELHEEVAVSQSASLGQSAYMDELEAERNADRIAGRRRQKKAASRHRRKDGLVTALVVLVILAGVGLIVHRSIKKTTEPEVVPETPIQDIDPPAIDLSVGSPPIAVPSTRPTTRPATHPATRPSPPQLAQATARLTAGKQLLFAHGTEFPAATGQMYVLLDIELQAGGVPISIHTDNVKLKVKGRSYPALGLPTTQGTLPLRAQPADLKLRAGTSKTWQLLFEVPATLASAEVIAGSLPRMRLKLRPFPPYEGKVNGKFKEVLPRRLKPLLTDPVMAAIQRTPSGRLHISKGGDKYQVLLPEAGITSEPFKFTRGQTNVTLVRDQQPLVVTLRYKRPHGNLLILSLDNSPLHQLVFRRVGAPVKTAPGSTQPPDVIMEQIPSKPTPAKPSDSSNIDFFGTSTK